MKKITITLFLLIIATITVSAQEIFDAINANDLEKVKAIVSQNPLAKDQIDLRGRSALHYAIEVQNLDILNFLIKEKADVNVKDDLGRTLLMSLIFKANVDTDFAVALIRAGVNIDEKDKFGTNALVYAAQIGNKEIVDILLSNNVVIPIDPPYGDRLLYSCVQNGLKDLMNILIEKGVSTKIIGLLHAAATKGQVEIIKDLLKLGIDVNQVSKGWTPLHTASYNGNIPTMDLLLANGADLFARTSWGQSCANLADENEKREALEYLIAKGLELDKPKFPFFTGEYLGQKTPGKIAEVFAPIIFNTPYTLHSNVVFSPDGKEVYWSNAFGDNFTVVSRYENGKWTYPEKAISQSIPIEDVPFYHPSGHLFYDLARFRKFPSGLNREKEDIWVWERNGNVLSNPKPLPEEINIFRLHWQYSVDGKNNIYFGQVLSGGEGKNDIWVSKFENGIYQPKTNMGKNINSGEEEQFPYIQPDGDYILFTRNNDIYVSFWNKKGDWTIAKPLGPEVNTSGMEMLPTVSPDGKYLFFWRNHTIYWISSVVLEELRPKE